MTDVGRLPATTVRMPTGDYFWPATYATDTRDSKFKRLNDSIYRSSDFLSLYRPARVFCS